MGLRERIQNFMSDRNPEALLADGFEEAFIGIAERCACPPLAVYDAWKCIEILIKRDQMDPDEAMEFFQFNTLGAWVGEGTPLFMWNTESMDDG